MDSQQKFDLIRKILSLHVRVVKIKDQINDVNDSLHRLMQELVQAPEPSMPTVTEVNLHVNEVRLRNLSLTR